jgi:CubicO group peptidase (beta-lactamase class C family)
VRERNRIRNVTIVTVTMLLALCAGGVCPAFSDQQVITFNDNGGWCWFQDERVIVVDDTLVIGSVANQLGTDGAERGGNVEVTTFDLAGGSQPVTTILHTKFQNDDHDAPALLALPDKRILAVYATHGSDELIRCRTSSHPADGTTWQPERQVARQARVTYSNLFLSPGEGDDVGRIYNFYRGEHWNPNWVFSDDSGANWQYGGRLIAFEGRPYAKYASNGRDTIHVIATEHHPHNYPNSIYHAYLKNGELHKSDGTVIGGVSEGPIGPHQATKVFAGDKDHVAWMCDMHLDAEGHPFFAYSAQKQLDPNHIRYRYARWDGRTWNDHFLAHAGTALYKGEEHYSGLVALDPADPNKLYISTDADPTTGQPLISGADQQRHYEIFAGHTHDEGTTWQWHPITKDSDVDNLRPIVPIGCGSRNVLLWLHGAYRSYTEYDLDVVGIVEENPTPEQRADGIFRQLIQEDAPGAAVAVVKDGAIVYKNGFGRAHMEYDVPITPSTVFHVASISKQFTAFAIALLADEGKLSLDDDIRRHLPDVPDFGKTITIQHLIHHTSGLRDQWELFVMAGGRLDDVITQEHIIKLVRRQQDLNFDPGAEHLYCNTGYTLLAEIVARVSGQSFPEYTAAHIFEPLGMTSTHFHDDHELIVPNRAYSYARKNDGTFKKSVLSYANAGATSLFTTVEDLAKWMANFETKTVGGSAVIEQMQQRGKLNDGTELNYACGLNIGEYRGLRTIGHGGADAGFRSNLLWFGDRNFGVVVLSNLGSFNPRKVARDVVDVYLADVLTPRETKTEKTEPAVATVDTRVYDDYVGQYQLPGMTITITTKDDRLIGQATDQPEVELRPESETRFYAMVADSRVFLTFRRGDGGEVTQLVVRQNGDDMTAEKTTSQPPRPDQLDEFAGEYYSGELDTIYTILVREGSLLAQHKRHEDIPLTAETPDRLRGTAWWFSQLDFERDENGSITGFKLTGGRARNLRFKRQTP